jgi:hypothetical protein
MAAKMATCPHHKNINQQSTSCSEDSKDCCNNETVFIESDIDKQLISIDFFDLNNIDFVVANTITSFKDLIKQTKDVIPFVHYKPPLILKDIPVLYESFLL